MESGPAVFSGVVFALFGAGLLAWTAVRVGQRRPVAQDVSPVASAALAGLAGTACLVLGAWCLTRM